MLKSYINPRIINMKKIILRLIVKLIEIKNKKEKKILKATRDKQHITYN